MSYLNYVAHAQIARAAASRGLSYHVLNERTGVVLKSNTRPVGNRRAFVREEILYQLWVDERGVRKARFLGITEDMDDKFISEMFPR